MIRVLTVWGGWGRWTRICVYDGGREGDLVL